MKDKTILVSVIMGSDSDWKIMKQAEDVLVEFGIPCDVRVVSAHRSPGLLTHILRTLGKEGPRL